MCCVSFKSTHTNIMNSVMESCAIQSIEMEALRLPRQFWVFCGFYCDESTSLIQRILGHVVSFFIVFYLSMIAVLALLFLYFEDIVTTESILNVGYEFVTASAAVLTFFIVSFKKGKLIEMTKKLQNDVNRRVNSETIDFYQKAEYHCDYAMKLLIIYFVSVYVIAFPLYIFLNWIYESIIGDVNVEGWFSIYVFW